MSTCLASNPCSRSAQHRLAVTCLARRVESDAPGGDKNNVAPWPRMKTSILPRLQRREGRAYATGGEGLCCGRGYPKLPLVGVSAMGWVAPICR